MLLSDSYSRPVSHRKDKHPARVSVIDAGEPAFEPLGRMDADSGPPQTTGYDLVRIGQKTLPWRRFPGAAGHGSNSQCVTEIGTAERDGRGGKRN